MPHYSNSQPNESRRRPQRLSPRSPLVLILLVLVWCILLGGGLAWATDRPSDPVLAQATTTSPIGTTDVVPGGLRLAQEVYLERCATCHIGVPPGVLPTETWRQILLDAPRHYTTQITPLDSTTRLLLWQYLRNFSRTLREDEEMPFQVSRSRYFTALHPRVKVSRSLQLSGCISCHPGAKQYNFRSLTAEWENAP
ncbi:MAG: diheme cytochrome C [Leptolyngbyaceae cyanobacterium bins.59]|nr:diheme cytochrome C [Leptolyngbyaceae cyanobacterium bins.59]